MTDGRDVSDSRLQQTRRKKIYVVRSATVFRQRGKWRYSGTSEIQYWGKDGKEVRHTGQMGGTNTTNKNGSACRNEYQRMQITPFLRHHEAKGYEFTELLSRVKQDKPGLETELNVPMLTTKLTVITSLM